jgi:hypothetical protein
MSLDPNALFVAKRLQAEGYTRGQIAGVLGNLQLESGFNPRINEGGKVGPPLGVGGFGMPQWTGGRQTNLINFAKQKGLDPGSVEAQADFLVYELKGPEKRADQSLRGAVSPEEAARRFLTDFERAGIPKTEQRQKAAREIYGKLSALEGQPTSSQGTQQVPAIDPQQLLKAFASQVFTSNPTLGSNVLGLLGELPPVTQNVFDAGRLTPQSSYLTQLTRPLTGL